MKSKVENRELVREKTLAVPMNSTEKECIKKAAAEMGLTMSAFVRFVLKEFVKKES